ncbi:glutathionylspermidine synthase family protein [Winogradskyella eckloniae]|uniref:glutathionylspermidine synthase family protein n=1 Tax=Winogradskyella eckloniae TaxID=1089306 RepID=UPI0015667EAC|nr:glutathionylspermidine synthase family protein [Winogradskyella eckloniae]NRD20307.1 glutathionylspermidine synthase family protein [Winogradskyella eckloniae]
MAVESRLDRLEDSRFKEIKRLKKKHVPNRLHWFLGEDYFSEELLGIYRSEVEQLRRISDEAFYLFQRATDKIIADNKLGDLNIPLSFQNSIIHSWKNKSKHPFLYGRFDINGGLKSDYGRIIEFNADTCSTIPETLLWQPLQLAELKGNPQNFNTLSEDIKMTLTNLKATLTKSSPTFLGTSFGYVEDVENVNCIIDIAYQAGFKPLYSNLENVIFSDEGVFYEIGGEFEEIDVLFKMVPWDWMFNDEPELAQTLSELIINDKVVVLNPPYTAIWQNKKFLAYITQNFPNNILAETYLQQEARLGEYVKKPVYGRLGENIAIETATKARLESKGDYGKQDMVFQKYYPLNQDLEKYYYQIGMFYTTKASAINLRAQDSPIITDDCEFMSHFII